MSEAVSGQQARPPGRAVACPPRPPGRALACALVAVLLVVATATATAAAPASAASVVQFNRETYHYTSTLSIAQEAQRYSVMVLQAPDHAVAAKLKAANPSLKILMYSDVMDSSPGDQGLTKCTGWSTASAHPSWFLLDQNGHRITPPLYPNNYLMDQANPSYQQACASHAAALAKQYGFDGVWFDGLTAWIGWAVPSGLTVPKYPTAAAWQPAVYSLISYTAPVLHAQHLLMVGNIGGAATAPGLWQKWTTPMDGSEDEQFADANFTYYWSTQIANAAWSEANHKIALLHSHSTTEAGNTYGLASMMLVAQGSSSYSTSNANVTKSELWFPEYALAQSLGAPTSPSTQLPGGVYLRTFANGLVAVNASSSTQNVNLGGGTYSGSLLTNVTSVALAPWSGVILANNSAITPGAPLNLVAPAITGKATQGHSLTANNGLWFAVPAPTYAYQWYRCTTTSVSSCSPIAGATTGTYRIVAADAGRYIVLSVTASNTAGTKSMFSGPTAIPASVAPRSTGVPRPPRCVSPTGKLTGTRLGALSLGEPRPAARASFNRYTARGHRDIDVYCISGGRLRAGYASRELLRRLSIRPGRGLVGRLVMALTSDRFYALRGIKPGTKLAIARRSLRPGPGYSAGGYTWYLVRGHGAYGVLKVRSGHVEEIGIVNARLTSTAARARLFLRSFTH